MNYEEYPDTDAVQLVTTASEITGLSAAVVLEDYGAFLGPHLFRAYRPLIDPSWKTIEFLEHAEATIHRVVRARNAHARPARPPLPAVRSSPACEWVPRMTMPMNRSLFWADAGAGLDRALSRAGRTRSSANPMPPPTREPTASDFRPRPTITSARTPSGLSGSRARADRFG